ncbi:hypothetical protein M422DRAFT_101604, partial [Sphaerobolus stellatus SS14]
VQVGDIIPLFNFLYVPYSEELEIHVPILFSHQIELTTDTWKGKVIVLVGVPGAFAPGCHVTHLSPYIAKAKEFKAKVADIITFVASNDPFVVSAWGHVLHAKGDILFLSDPKVELGSKLRLSLDLSALELELRDGRFAIAIDDFKVKYI